MEALINKLQWNLHYAIYIKVRSKNKEAIYRITLTWIKRHWKFRHPVLKRKNIDFKNDKEKLLKIMHVIFAKLFNYYKFWKIVLGLKSKPLFFWLIFSESLNHSFISIATSCLNLSKEKKWEGKNEKRRQEEWQQRMENIE